MKSNFIFLSYLSVVEPQEILDLIQFEGSKKFCKIYVYNSFRIIRGKHEIFFWYTNYNTPFRIFYRFRHPPQFVFLIFMPPILR